MKMFYRLRLVDGIVAGLLMLSLYDSATGALVGHSEEKSVLLTAPPVPNAVVRAAEFATRNSPENLKRLADDLFSMINLGMVAPAVRERYAKGDAAGALEAYRDFFIERLVLPPPGYPLGFGLNLGAQFFMPQLPDAPFWGNSLSTADELMSNIVVMVVQDQAGQKVRLRMDRGGVPGCFNWSWGPAGYTDPSGTWSTNIAAMVSRHMEFGSFFDPLLGQYFKTKDRRYLDKWVQLNDDRFLNYNNERWAAGMKAFCDWSSGLEYLTHGLLLKMAYLARTMPGFAHDLPAPTLARLLRHYFYVRIPICIRAGRQATGNRSIGMHPSELWYMAQFFPEFKAGNYCIREFRRRVEMWPNTDMYPDGVTPGEETLSYVSCWPDAVYDLWNTTRRNDPPQEWATPAWGREINDKLKLKARNWLHEIYNNGGSFHCPAMAWKSYLQPNPWYVTRFVFPAEGLADLEVERIRSTVFADGSCGLPSFTSECFPYGGHYLLRSGWSTNNDVLVFMLNNPAAHQADVLGIELYAYGKSMLESAFRPPLKPDGMTQPFTTDWASYYNERHDEYVRKVMNIYLNIQPQSNRWHSSGAFAFCEATYAGLFVNRSYAQTANTTDKSAGETPPPFITDIRHQRQILMIQQAKAFVVTDRLTSERPHKYRVEWYVGLPNANPTLTNNIIRTLAPNSPNLSIYQFRSKSEGTALELDLSGCTFEGTGNEVLVSLLYPRRTLEDEVKEIRSLPGTEKNVCGFDATFADGTRVLCQTAPTPERLQAADVAVVAEQLVLIQTPEGERRGIILGCKELKIAGRVILSPGPDFEFMLAKQHTFKRIYYPLGLVRILPQTDCFVDKLEVTLEPPVSDVDIRYTTDSSDPDVNSPLYRGPFKIHYTTTLKARAFRKGVTKVPVTFDNNLVSAVNEARFTKLAYRKPAVLAGETLAPGLGVKYYEGDWTLSALFLDRCRLIEQGQSKELFDLTLRRPVTNNYGFIYVGYLDIPQDGVYSFYAPAEMYCPRMDAGYDLRVFLDDVEWYPGTRLHNLGVWSIPLQRGPHRLQVVYVDQRPGQLYWQYPYPEFESFQVWRGEKPVIMISGPGLEQQPLPATMLRH